MTRRDRIIFAAIHGLHDEGFETEKLNCARWVRQVIDSSKVLAAPMPAGMNAREQFEYFKRRGYAVEVEHGSVAGDIIYKLGPSAGKFGHVAIRIYGNAVAENSIVHARRDNDARGIRTLEQFGPIWGIVRLW